MRPDWWHPSLTIQKMKSKNLGEVTGNAGHWVLGSNHQWGSRLVTFVFFLLRILNKTKSSDSPGMAHFKTKLLRAEKSDVLDHQVLCLALDDGLPLLHQMSVPCEINARQGPGPHRLTEEAQ